MADVTSPPEDKPAKIAKAPAAIPAAMPVASKLRSRRKKPRVAKRIPPEVRAMAIANMPEEGKPRLRSAITPLTPAEHKLNTLSIAERAGVIDRNDLADALLHSTNPKERELGSSLQSNDSHLRSLSVGQLAFRHGITYREVMDCYRDMRRMVATAEIAREMPAIAKDIATDARTVVQTCATCEGSGRVAVGIDDDDQPVIKPCIPCNATGKITQRGDKDARRMALDIMEMSKGTTIMNAPGSQMLFTGEGTLEDMLKRSRSRSQQQLSSHPQLTEATGNNDARTIDGTSTLDSAARGSQVTGSASPGADVRSAAGAAGARSAGASR